MAPKNRHSSKLKELLEAEDDYSSDREEEVGPDFTSIIDNPSAISTLNIREFDMEMIDPSTESMYDSAKGGSKIVVLGRPNSGKTYAITSILYHKRHIFPYGVVVSGTEASNSYWGKHFPETFIYERLSPDILERFVDRQIDAKKSLINPWSVLLLDDCADEAKVINGHQISRIFKNGRHWKMLFILAIQYAIDIRPHIRANIDYAFIFHENRLCDRKKLYDHYAACFPDFNTFCRVLETITEDYTALVIKNNGHSNSIEDNVFWYRAKPFPTDFKFGSPLYWQHHYERAIPSDPQ